MRENRLTKILGIVSHADTSPHTIGILTDVLESFMRRTRRHLHAASEPHHDTVIKPMQDFRDMQGLAGEVLSSQAVIIAASTHSITSLIGLGHELGKHDRGAKLRDIWVGLIGYGRAKPWHVEEHAYHVLYECNQAGMLLLPHAFAHMKVEKSREHWRLAESLAERLALENIWEGKVGASAAA